LILVLNNYLFFLWDKLLTIMPVHADMMDGVVRYINYFANDLFQLKCDACKCGGVHCVYNTQAGRIRRAYNPGGQSVFWFVLDGFPLVPPLMACTRGLVDASDYGRLQQQYRNKHFVRPAKLLTAGQRRRRNSSSPTSATRAFLFG
tara:strand:- start:56020 stop:56457 length:438 start_codon:yes stop_codon:yes gene_type:complete